MKRKFTFLMAALALLCFMLPPMTGWGQTRGTVTDQMTAADLSATGTTYTDFSNVTLTSDARYAGNSAKDASENIQLRSKNSNSGIVSTTSGGYIRSVTITVGSGANTIDVYGKNTAYTAASDLYSSTTQGTKIGSLTATGTISFTDDYQYVGIRSNNGAIYIASIGFNWETEGGDTPTPTTYSVTFDAGEGTFVGNTDFPNENNTKAAGTYTLPSAERSGYTFNGWTATGITEPTTGSYTVSADVDFTASFTENGGSSQGGTDVLNLTFTGITGGSGYSNWNDKEGTSGAVYAGNSAGGSSSANPSIQLRTSGSNSGIVSTTSGGKITKVEVTWNSSTTSGRILDIYGKNLAYSAATDLYNDNTAGTKIGSITRGNNNSTVLTINDDYEYIGMRSSNNAIYLDEIRITWVADTDPAVATTVTIDDTQLTNTDVYTNTEAGTLTATVKDNSNNTISGAAVTWESTDTDVATITDAGVVTLVAAGTTTIKALYAGITDQYKPSTGTYELTVTNSDPNAPGTENNPYTVAQARAAIDAGTGVTGVYATGIVSEIVTAYNSEYGNISYNISADGLTTSDQLQAYRGKNYNGDAFTSEDDILVGATVVVYGNLKKYNDTYEFDANNELVSYTAPTNPFINAEDVNIAYNATSGEIAYTITNPVDGQNLTATNTADWISNIAVASDKVTFACTANEGTADRTATITLSYTGAADKAIIVTQAHFVVDYATLPFEYDGDGTGTLPNGFTVEGLGTYTSSPKMQFNTTGDWAILHFNERPGVLSFDIKGNSFSNGTFTVQTSEDGTNYTDLKSYTTLGTTQSEEFSALGENVRYIKWIYTNKSNGNVALGNINLAKYVAPQPAITVASTTIDATAAETEGTLNVTYTLIEKENTTDIEIHWFESDGTTAAGQPSWIDADINSEFNVDYVIGVNENEARTAYFKVYGLDGDANDVYSDLVTVTQAAPAAPSATYTLVNSLNDLVSGKRYIIASGTDGTVYAMGLQNTNNRKAEPVTASSGVITGTDDVYEFVIIGPDAEGYYTLYDVVNAGYLYAAATSSSTNYLKVHDENDDKGRWSISFTDDAAVIKAKTAESDKGLMRYNSGSTIFSCYASGQQPVYLFAKDNETAVSYMTPTIAGFGNDNTVKNGWYLIASPAGQATPTVDNNFLANNYDLYAFNQSEEQEWRNYKANPFNLVSGHGYLYANSTNVKLTFEGMPYVGNGQVFLAYDENAEWKGWNLIGNPYSTNATVNKAYYKMNEERSEVVAVSSSVVAAMEGIFVIAENASQYVTFTPSRGHSALDNQLSLNLSRGAQNLVIDRAIVSFNESEQLPKFQLFEGSTKIYFTQEGHDYAIVNAEAQGELPVNFKAAENGTYTINVATENLDVDYLHLIDNLTGTDVDLLATPSYTFESRKNDYASRFRLRFSANNNDNSVSDEFAFVSNGEIVIMNEGEATLQVIDMLGRTVSTQAVDGNARIDKMSANGVYVLRLIDGNEVKTQKIVIE